MKALLLKTSKVTLAIAMVLMFVADQISAQTQIFSNPLLNGLPANTFTPPAGVTKVSVEAWGGGGAGGGCTGSNNNSGGGGGGGTMTFLGNVPVSLPVDVTVGAGGSGAFGANGEAGKTSIFNSVPVVSAVGGSFGGLASGTNSIGSGGSSTIGITFDGGAGANGNNANNALASGGAGGGGAGNGGDGGNAMSVIPSAGAGGIGSIPGGNGAAPQFVCGNGNNGPGLASGGSGGRNSNNGTCGVQSILRAGGSGGNGQVVVQFIVLTAGTIDACYETIAEAEEAAEDATTATDDCAGIILLTSSTEGEGCGVEITVTATNSCGQESQVVYITNINPPAIEFTCATDVTVEACSTQEEVDEAYEEFLNSTIASGGCGDAVTNNGPEVAPSFCGAIVEVTFTYDNTCDPDNSFTCTATFTVEESVAPVLVDPADDVTVECDGLGNDDELEEWLESNGGAVVTSDCGVNWSNDFEGLEEGCGATGTATVVFTATDDCEGSIATTATFTIKDTAAPDFSGCDADDLDDQLECLGAAGNEEAADEWNDDNITALELCVGDFCSDVTVSSDYDYDNLEEGCGETGTITVIYTATDDCGNTTTIEGTFTIIDTTEPDLSECEADDLDDELECLGAEDNEAAANEWNDDNIDLLDDCATDLCGDVTVTSDYDFDNLVEGCGATGTITVTYTLTDECENFTITEGTFTIVDTTIPDLSGCDEDNLDDTFECAGAAGNEAEADDWNDENISYLDGCATDLCGDVTVTSDYDFSNLSDGCGETGDITVTYTLTDECENSTTIEGTFTIIDTTIPDLTGCDEDNLDDTFECAGAAGNEAEADDWNDENISYLDGCATDLCGDVNVTSDYDFSNLSDGCGETGTITVTYTLTDECENSTTIEGTFTIIDTTIPDLTGCNEDNLDDTFECAGAAGNEAEADDWNAENISYLDGCATDLCGDVTVTSNYDFANLSDGCGETGTITVTYTLTDECENSTTTEGTFTIIDTTIPDLSGCEADNLDDTFECAGAAGNEAEADDWNDENISYLDGCATDLCGDVTVTSDYDFSNLSDGCGETGDITVTYTLTDECENSTTIEGTFTIIDTTIPDLTGCDEDNLDDTFECAGAEGNEAEADDWNDENIAYLDGCATDLCGDVTVTSDYDFSNLSDGCGETGDITVTYTLTDECENSTTIEGTFTIIDTTIPDLTGCDEDNLDNTFECAGAAGNEAEADDWNDENISYLDGCATDLCGDVTVTSDYDFSNLSDGCGETGSITVTYTLTDECENSTTIEGTFTIIDTTIPDLTGCDEDNLDDTFECAGAEGNETAANTWNSENIEYLDGCATDLCGDVTVTSDYDFANLSDGCGETGTITVIYTLTDECENSTTTEGTFTIIDTTIPDLSGCEADDLDDDLECLGAEGNEEAADDWNSANIELLDGCATDLCGDVTVTSDYDFANLSDGCGETGTITVTYTLTDECENSTTTEGTFTINDTTVPDLSGCEADDLDATQECLGAEGNEEAADDWNSANIELLDGCATDLCGDVTVSSNYNFDGLSDDCGATGTITVTYTLTDECENSTTTEGTFTIVDTTAPGIEPAADDLTVECDGEGNEADLATWLAENGGAVATDACSEVLWSNDFEGLTDDCGATGSVTVTFTATDDCQNATTTVGTFTIEDTTPPVALCQDITIDLEDIGNIDITAEDVDAGSFDGCGEVTLELSPDDLDCPIGAILTLTVTDECGNTATCTASVIIDIPEIVSCGRNGDKVSICHIPPGNPEKQRTLCIGLDGLCDHLAHGCYIGVCGDPASAEPIPTDNTPATLNTGIDLSDKSAIVETNVVISNEATGVNPKVTIEPNPFNNQTTIRFGLEATENVSLRVFNNVGQLVTTLYEGSLDAGNHEYIFDGSYQADGLYIYSLTTGKKVESGRMMLVR